MNSAAPSEDTVSSASAPDPFTNKNHYIPKFLLRRWGADPKKKHVRVADLLNNTCDLRPINETAQVPGQVDFNQAWNQYLDDPVSKILGEIRVTQIPNNDLTHCSHLSLDSAHRELLGHFIFSWSSRSPHSAPNWGIGEAAYLQEITVAEMSQAGALRNPTHISSTYEWFRVRLSPDKTQFSIGTDGPYVIEPIRRRLLVVLPISPSHGLVMAHRDVVSDVPTHVQSLDLGEISLGTASTFFVLPPNSKLSIPEVGALKRKWQPFTFQHWPREVVL